MEIVSIIILSLISFFAATYGSIVGGGGLLTTPILIALGLPPHLAVGTSRTGAIPSPIIGLYKFNKTKLINWKIALLTSGVGIIGFLIGLLLFFQMNENILKVTIAIISLAGLGLLFYKKDLGIKKKKVSTRGKTIGYLIVFFIAVYAGFYGAMFATFLSYVLIMFFGMTFLESIGTRKLFAFARHLITIPILILAGKVYFPYAIIMVIATGAGAYLGCHYAPKIGNKMIKYLFGIITLIAVISMFI
jgi:uncharacterized protein